MPNFAYEAIDDKGEKVSGNLSAADEGALEEQLGKKGLYLVDARIQKKSKEFTIGGNKVTRKELIKFTMYLNTLISAGVPLITGLNQIADQSEIPYFKKVIREMSTDIQGGQSISTAMAKYPKAFDKMYSSVIRAGEASGKLEMILDDLAIFLQWQEDLNKKIKKATMYPLILVGTISSLILVLIVFVFPKFMTMFEGVDMELPGPTKAVMFVSDMFNNYWHIMLGTVVFIVVAYKIYIRFPAGRLKVDKIKLKLPVFGQLFTKVAVSRFSHYLGVVLRAGVDIIQSLQIVEELVGNAAIARVVRAMREMIEGGQKVAEAMERYPEFPPMVVQMVAVGEMSGKLETNLAKVSEFYDREVPETIDKCLAMIQPIIIVGMAGAVIVVALAIFLPMFQMGGH